MIDQRTEYEIANGHYPITEDWLREVGFRWHDVERSPGKHWTLWLGSAAADEGQQMVMSDGLIIELSKVSEKFDQWFVWIRADYAGRYTRFVHVRHMRYQHEVIKLIEAMTGQDWDRANVWYGSLYKPAQAARLRADSERMENRLAREWGKRVERETGADPDKRELLRP